MELVMAAVFICIALTIALYIIQRSDKAKMEVVGKHEVSLKAVGELEGERDFLLAKVKEEYEQNQDLSQMLVDEKERNRIILSQKKSNETRLGQISEHLIPFLANCQHDPKNMHFMGNPIDYLAFDYDEGSIYFIEVKSGNSKPTKRQKTIRDIIKTGRVFYEEVRINQKGISSKVAKNE